MTTNQILEQALELRQAFDRAFAEPPPAPSGATTDLIAIRLAEAPFALRLADVKHLATDWRIEPVPTPVPALLGLAGFRGALVPVYDLAGLIGRARPAPGRWIALVGDVERLAVVFDTFDRFIRLSRDDLVPADGGVASRFVREVVSLPEGSRPILDVAALIDSIQRPPG